MAQALRAGLRNGGIRRGGLRPGLGNGSLFAIAPLDMFFARTRTLDSRVTFTRSSSGTYVGSDGLLKTATTNEPRFDHNPTTGESLGLLVEEQRVNSIRNNTMVGAVAGTPGTSPTNWIVSTAAGITRELVGVGTENGINYIDYRFSGTATGSSDTQFDGGSVIAALSGQSWTSSVYVKVQAGSLANTTITQIISENSAAGGFLAASTQNITPTSSALSQQRASLSRTLNNASTAYVITTLRVTSAGAIDITLRIGLPQLEQGAFATSVIPTTGTTATRSADVASITGTNFSSWYSQSEGTVFADAFGVNNISGATRRYCEIRDAASSERLVLGYSATNNNRFLVVDNSVTVADILTTSLPTAKTAGAYKLNSFQLASNGTLGTEDGVGTVPTPDQMQIGSQEGSTANTFLNGTIRRLCFWPARLPNSTLQTLTQ